MKKSKDKKITAKTKPLLAPEQRKWWYLRLFCVFVPVFSWFVYLLSDKELNSYRRLLDTTMSTAVLQSIAQGSVILAVGLFLAKMSSIPNSALYAVSLCLCICILAYFSKNRFLTGSILLSAITGSLVFQGAVGYSHLFFSLFSLIRIQLFLRDREVCEIQS